MESFLGGRFVPLTFSIGFIEKPLAFVGDEYLRWSRNTRMPSRPFLSRGACRVFSRSLSHSLRYRDGLYCWRPNRRGLLTSITVLRAPTRLPRWSI